MDREEYLAALVDWYVCLIFLLYQKLKILMKFFEEKWNSRILLTANEEQLTNELVSSHLSLKVVSSCISGLFLLLSILDWFSIKAIFRVAMREAIFQILKEETSLELIMGSYELLNELDKRFPRVCLPKMEEPASCLAPTTLRESAVVEEAWCPFTLGLDRNEETNKCSSGSIDFLGFHSLIQELGEMTRQKSKALETKILRKMLLLHYLVSVLEGDFVPRHEAFKDKISWTLLRDSLLNMLLGSRKIIYKGLVKDCLSVICDVFSDLSDQSESSSDVDSVAPLSNKLSYNCIAAFALALPELKRSTCIYLKKLLRMMMDLDASRNVAHVQGLTTRADGVRSPASEIILDELAYNSDMLSSFFQVFDEPWWKLKTITQYFQKYIPKTSVHTRRSNVPVNGSSFEGVLKCFSNSSSTKNIIKKIGADVAQLLIGHAFLAYLSVSMESSAENDDFEEILKGSSLTEICKHIIAAFTSIRKEDKFVVLEYSASFDMPHMIY
ncbi:putative peroxidase 19-like [Capsicum annuum]|nr:putative peroxidase 19-like [Capsicum annuum]